ncbi:MAG TPA: hypothetical protein VEV15_00560, partial [Flavisolibacter sp.]|nr:hypothetical protein [Flavisolibacter sp.]
EDLSNKSTNVTTDGASDTKYPSVKAVKTYVDAQATTPDANSGTKGKIQLTGDLGGTAASPTVPALANKEDKANKSIDVTTDGASDVKYPSVKAVKTYVDAQATTPDATTLAKGKIQLAGDLAGTAAAPTVPALANKENLSNKSTNVTTDGASDTKYPSVKAVKAYVDAQVSGGVADATLTATGKIQLAGDLAGTATAPTVPKLTTKEDLTNKSTNVTTDGASDTKYPSVKAVKTYVDAQATTPDANATTKGKIKLAGDLAGTADLPAVADNAITTTKINNGAVTDAKLATGISGSKISGDITGKAANVTGVIAIANGGTGASTQAGAANALLPAQTGQSGKVLQTDGTNVSWVASSGGSLPTPANPADNGKVLTANNGLATWAPAGSGGTMLVYHPKDGGGNTMADFLVKASANTVTCTFDKANFTVRVNIPAGVQLDYLKMHAKSSDTNDIPGLLFEITGLGSAVPSSGFSDVIIPTTTLGIFDSSTILITSVAAQQSSSVIAYSGNMLTYGVQIGETKGKAGYMLILRF